MFWEITVKPPIQLANDSAITPLVSVLSHGLVYAFSELL